MRKHGTVWAYVFLVIVALMLLGMRRADQHIEDSHSSVAVQQAVHKQVALPLPVTPTPLLVTVTTVVTATDTAPSTATPAITQTVTPTVTPTPTFIPTSLPTDANPFPPTPTRTPLAIYLPSVVRQEFKTLRNGGFEEGNEPWTWKSRRDYEIILPVALLVGVLPHSGEWAAWLGGALDEQSMLAQSVTIPMARPVLHYWYRYGVHDGLCAAGKASVKISSEETMKRYDLCSSGPQEWRSDSIDLSAYAGRTIMLTFLVEVGATGTASSFYLDDIEWIEPTE